MKKVCNLGAMLLVLEQPNQGLLCFPLFGSDKFIRFRSSFTENQSFSMYTNVDSHNHDSMSQLFKYKSFHENACL